MNWIISKTQISFHTNLYEILKPIWKDLSEYNWIITDVDFITDDNIPLDFDHDYFIFDKKNLKHFIDLILRLYGELFRSFRKT